MNYSQLTLDQLFERIDWLNGMKSRKEICGLAITQRGIDRANQELSAIEAELDMRQPVGEFVILLGDDGLVGFELGVDN